MSLYCTLNILPIKGMWLSFSLSGFLMTWKAMVNKGLFVNQVHQSEIGGGTLCLRIACHFQTGIASAEFSKQLVLCASKSHHVHVQNWVLCLKETQGGYKHWKCNCNKDSRSCKHHYEKWNRGFENRYKVISTHSLHLCETQLKSIHMSHRFGLQQELHPC